MTQTKLTKERPIEAIDILLIEIPTFNRDKDSELYFYDKLMFRFNPDIEEGKVYEEDIPYYKASMQSYSYTEYELVDDAMEYPELRDKLHQLLKVIIQKFSARQYFWINDETQAGQYLSHRLAKSDKQDLSLYKEYLISFDIDHQVGI